MAHTHRYHQKKKTCIQPCNFRLQVKLGFKKVSWTGKENSMSEGTEVCFCDPLQDFCRVLISGIGSQLGQMCHCVIWVMEMANP